MFVQGQICCNAGKHCNNNTKLNFVLKRYWISLPTSFVSFCILVLVTLYDLECEIF